MAIFSQSSARAWNSAMTFEQTAALNIPDLSSSKINSCFNSYAVSRSLSLCPTGFISPFLTATKLKVAYYTTTLSYNNSCVHFHCTSTLISLQSLHMYYDNESWNEGEWTNYAKLVVFNYVNPKLFWMLYCTWQSLRIFCLSGVRALVLGPQIPRMEQQQQSHPGNKIWDV